jgi:hypothetical protein
VYDAIAAADIPGLDASKIVSGRFSVSRLPDGTSGYVLVGQGTGYDMAWRDISGIAGTITDTQHGTKTGIPFAHHGDWGHYGKIPTSAPTGAAERAYVDSANLYVHDGTSWVLRATKDWNNLINKPSTFPPTTHASTHASGGSDPVSLDASQITSGRLSLSRIPTSATANRVLLVRTANADPTYDQVDWNTDIKNIPSTFPPSAHASTHEYGGTDLVRNLDYLAIRGTTVINSSRNLVGINVVAQNLVPDIDITRNLGSSSYHFYTLYCGYMQRANGPIGILPYSELNLGGGNSYRWQINTSGHLIPASDNSFDIGSSSLRVRNLYLAGAANVGSLQIAGTTVIDSSRILQSIASVAQSLLPSADNTYDLGSSSYRWRNLYLAGTANVGSLQIGGTTVIDSSRNLQNIASIVQSLLPSADGTYDFGSSTYRWRNLYLSGTANVGSLYVGGTVVITSDRMLSNIAYLATSLVPYLDNTYDIGASLSRIRNIYVAGTANVGSVLPVGGAGSGYVGNSTYYWYAVYSYWGYFVNLYPKDGDNTGALGSTERRWASFYAVNKNAAFKHPLHNPERYIVFKCVESPKVTVEDWGIAKLKDGKAFVGFSEEFVALMSDKTEYAVFLTPEGECNGLYVSKKEFYGFEVKELKGGKSNIQFSWHVKAIRIGDEETPVLEEPAPTEPEKREEWTAKRREAAQKKEEDRLNRMKQKIAKYREATSQT